MTEVKTFRYHIMSVLMAYGPAAFGLAVLALFTVLMLVLKGGAASWMLYAGVIVFGVQALVPVAVIFNLRKAVVAIGSEGISYTSPFKNLQFRWLEVAEIRMVYLMAGRYGGPPRDMEIELRNGKQLKILNFILSAETDNWDQDGMTEFEALVKEYSGKRIIEP